MQVMKMIIVISCVMLSVSTSLASQPPPPGRGYGRGDSFFELVKEVHRESLNREILGLLIADSVRDSIRLTEEDSTEIVNQISESMRELHELSKSNATKRLPRDELRRQIENIVVPAETATLEKVEAAGDMDMLLRIFAQMQEYRSIASTRVAEKLGIDVESDTFRKIKSIRTERAEAYLVEKRKEIHGHRRLSRDEIFKLFREAHKEVNRRVSEEIKAVLSQDQQDAFEKFKGDELEVVAKLKQEGRKAFSGMGGGTLGGGRGSPSRRGSDGRPGGPGRGGPDRGGSANERPPRRG